MAKEASLPEVWRERISKAKKFREDDFDKVFECEKARKWFEGRQEPSTGVPEGEWITVNKIYAHLLTELPALYGIDPYFYVKLKKAYTSDPEQIPPMEARAAVREAYLNHLKGECKLKDSARLAILDAEFAFGVIKVHYEAHFEDNPEKGTPLKDEEGNPILDDESGEPLMNPDQLLVNEKYRVSRVHPDNIIWGRDSGPLGDDWDWIAQKIQMTREQAKADKTLSSKAVSTAQAKPRHEEDKSVGGTSQQLAAKDPDNEVLTCWEIYDIKRKQWLKYLEGADELAMEPTPTPREIDGHPYSVLRFTVRDKSPYPIPPASQALDQQREINEGRSKRMVHRKRFNRKYEVNVNMLDSEDELYKLEVGDDGTIIKVQQTGAVQPIKDAPLDQQDMLEMQALERDMMDVLGPAPDSLQISSADSATEAAIVDQRMNMREGDKLSIVTEWVTDIGRKLDKLVQAHITGEEAVRVAGPSGTNWEIVKAEDYEEIQGEYEYTINVGASQPRIPSIERSQWLAFLQVIGQAPQLMTSERLMQHMAELHNIDDEAMVKELVQVGKMMLQSQDTGGANVPGVNPENPLAAIVGGALGANGVANEAA